MEGIPSQITGGLALIIGVVIAWKRLERSKSYE
jgi:hypothetical protein